MTKRFFLIVLLLFSVITTAQERISSPYSFYGVGLNTFRGTVESKSMGGINFFSDSIHLNLVNPAAYGRLRLTTYTLGASHSSVNVESNSDAGSTNNTSLDYLAIGIPTGKFGFGFGLLPYSSVGYNIIDVDEEAGTAGRFSGKGGLNKVFLSAGFEVTKNLSLGAEINYNFGNIENKNIFIREGLQFGTREINSSNLSGFSYKFGLDYARMLGEDLEFRFGTFYTPEANIESSNERQLATILFSPTGGEVLVDAKDLDVENSEITLPSSYTFGTGIGQPRKWFLGAEYSRTGVADFSNRSFELQGADYSEANKYRLGGFYIPNYTSLTSYLSRVVYRGGIRFEETGLSLQGEDINEFGISFGVGLPAGNSTSDFFSNINVGFEYGQRGTTNSGLVQENFFNAMISLSLNAKWFIKRKFE